jgi:polyhydroxyalkanoate synthesis regulator phasin
MSQVLSEVSQSDQPWAAQRAKYALEVHNAVQNGQLTGGEAREILEDLVRTDRLDQEATDQQLRAALVFGITQLVSLY